MQPRHSPGPSKSKALACIQEDAAAECRGYRIRKLLSPLLRAAQEAVQLRRDLSQTFLLEVNSVV